MIDFNDPASIIRWFRQNPKRHGPQLAALARLPLFREFKDTIRLAGSMLKAMPA